MRQKESNNYSRKDKHLNWEERIQIEVLHREGFSARKIAERLTRSDRTIRRELKRGWVVYRTGQYCAEERYNAQRGQTIYEQRNRPSTSKAINEELVEYIRSHILEDRESPAVIASKLKRETPEHAICFKTIYNLIDRGLITGVTNESLWEKRLRKKRYKSIQKRRSRPVPLGRSIENRPLLIKERKEVGHWEIDLVVGGKGQGSGVLLTLSERVSRKVIMRKLKNRTQQAVIRAINGIERQMGKEAFRVTFKSITADNGSEFLDFTALEHSVFGRGYRTKIHYAHPYSSREPRKQ